MAKNAVQGPLHTEHVTKFSASAPKGRTMVPQGFFEIGMFSIIPAEGPCGLTLKRDGGSIDRRVPHGEVPEACTRHWAGQAVIHTQQLPV